MCVARGGVSFSERKTLGLCAEEPSLCRRTVFVPKNRVRPGASSLGRRHFGPAEGKGERPPSRAAVEKRQAVPFPPVLLSHWLFGGVTLRGRGDSSRRGCAGDSRQRRSVLLDPVGKPSGKAAGGGCPREGPLRSCSRGCFPTRGERPSGLHGSPCRHHVFPAPGERPGGDFFSQAYIVPTGGRKAKAAKASLEPFHFGRALATYRCGPLQHGVDSAKNDVSWQKANVDFCKKSTFICPRSWREAFPYLARSSPCLAASFRRGFCLPRRVVALYRRRRAPGRGTRRAAGLLPPRGGVAGPPWARTGPAAKG